MARNIFRRLTLKGLRQCFHMKGKLNVVNSFLLLCLVHPEKPSNFPVFFFNIKE